MIIQARMGSTRLPGKSMMDLAGRPLVWRILERVTRCTRLDEIVLAIPDTPADRVLEPLARDHGVSLFAGSESDLVDRYWQCAVQSRADIVVRLPADNATPEPAEIDRIVEHHLALGRPGFSSNLAEIAGNRYPDGIGAEVFDFSLLQHAHAHHHDPAQREHVHLNFYNYATGQAVDANWCPVSTVPCPPEFARPDLVLDVNTQPQYEFIRSLYEALYPTNPKFHITDTIRWYDEVYRQQKSRT
jgi:spore coat polysaccharide biosynthesis protein SpsF